MTAALLNVCVDPRLNHDALRHQLRQRIGDGAPRPERIFVTTDVGGNLGSSAKNTISLLRSLGEDIAVAAVLHHNDCLAAHEGMRHKIELSAKALAAELTSAGFHASVWTGSIIAETSSIIWSDSPQRSLEVLTFRMPRMYGGR